MLTWKYVNFLNFNENTISNSFTIRNVEIPTQKGRSLMNMYRVVPQTKRVNFSFGYDWNCHDINDENITYLHN